MLILLLSSSFSVWFVICSSFEIWVYSFWVFRCPQVDQFSFLYQKRKFAGAPEPNVSESEGIGNGFPGQGGSCPPSNRWSCWRSGWCNQGWASYCSADQHPLWICLRCMVSDLRFSFDFHDFNFLTWWWYARIRAYECLVHIGYALDRFWIQIIRLNFLDKLLNCYNWY